MQALAHVGGAIVIVGGLILVALSAREADTATAPQPTVVKAEFVPPAPQPQPRDADPGPPPALPLTPLAPVTPPRLAATAAQPDPQVESRTADAVAPETVGRSVAVDRAETLARYPRLKRKSRALRARAAGSHRTRARKLKRKSAKK